MRQSPRIRRLGTDLRAMQRLRGSSSILSFQSQNGSDHPPEVYVVRFRGSGVWRSPYLNQVLVREQHEVFIRLGVSYPRMMPELRWKTPIFHPNISANGMVCLGGYGTHWVPSVNLDELCEMLWDMIRYQNFDVESPFNREAAYWAKSQADFRFPLDSRPIRDRLAGEAPDNEQLNRPPITAAPKRSDQVAGDGIVILGSRGTDEVIDAEIVDREDQDILFLD